MQPGTGARCWWLELILPHHRGQYETLPQMDMGDVWDCSRAVRGAILAGMRFAPLAQCRILAGLLMLAAIPSSAQKPKKAVPTPAPTPTPTSKEREILPPFSLMWHESSERLEIKIETAKLSITERRKVDGHWIVTTGGFTTMSVDVAENARPCASVPEAVTRHTIASTFADIRLIGEI